ncbi:MAG: metallophosphoesterase family protein [Bacillota bacterium]|nr:metallophosphoesterase family protein [Bacillota bacterium]
MKLPRFIIFILSIILFILLSIIVIKISHKNTPVMGKPQLKFNSNGTFKIVQFADIQDGADTDARTIALMNKILDYEKPDLVVLTGDNVDYRCKSATEVKIAIYNISKPMEKRHIPWAIVFGNHDEDHGQMNEEEMMKLYMSYPYNISQMGSKEADSVGNYNLLIMDNKGNKPIFNIYMLNSGKNAPDNIGGEDWIKFNQIQWYRDTSTELKKKFHKTIPALMFFHIPLPEFKQVWKSGNAVGEKNEEESTPKLNSGLFTSLVEMGDVKGVFVGHDHINDYVGELYGIKLGFSRNVGYGTYGKEDFSRGARVFLINKSNTDKFQTWMKLQSDFE